MAEDYDISKAFQEIEEELIASMIRNLKHHRAMETEEGFEWSQWQVVQLKALEEYRKQNQQRFMPKFQEINDSIDGLISIARQQGGMEQEIRILNAIRKGYSPKRTKETVEAAGEFMRVNDKKLDSLITATKSDFTKAEFATLRMANDKYRKIIFNAQVYANAGGTTYQKAVDMATKDFLKAGINCIEYKNGARHSIRDYADMCIRTTTKRAYLAGEGEKRKEWGISTVIINKRSAACPKCLPFCGVVLIDDVWSGGEPDGKHQLMSSAIEKGLYHPRCKDIHTTYFPGISTMPEKLSRDEKEKVVNDYNAEQKQNYYQRQAEQQERIARYSLDPENQRIHNARAAEWKSRIKSLKSSESTAIRHKEDGKQFIEITQDWLKNATPNSHQVLDLQEYIQSGTKYKVDGRNVLLAYSSKEKHIAELLESTLGGEIYMVPRVINPQNISTPDYLFRGENFDLKELQGTSNHLLYNAIARKKRQANNFILDISSCPLSMGEIDRQVEEIYWSKHTRFVEKLIIIKDDEIVKIYFRRQ